MRFRKGTDQRRPAFHNIPGARYKARAILTPKEIWSRVDILVVYKKSAREFMGGKDVIELAIVQDEGITNTASINS